MSYDIFLMPLLISFAISAILLVLLILFNKRTSSLDKRSEDRHIHKEGISRFGGAAIIIGFVIAIFFDKRLVIEQPLLGVLVASLAILIFGFIDDVRQLSWKKQLFFQILLVLFLYFMGIRLEYITNPFGGIFLLSGFWGQGIALLFSMLWIVFIINAMNWIDGVDGASGGVALIGAVTIFFLSLRPDVNQPPVAIITSAILGALLAFLFFNFYPAKILAGTSGAMFMGFILAIMAIFAGAKIATTLLVLAVPVIDALWVIGERFKSGRSVFLPDKRHLHFRLLDIGWSPKRICFFYYGITLVIAIVALNTYAAGKLVAFFSILLIMAGIYGIVHKRKDKKIPNNQI